MNAGAGTNVDDVIGGTNSLLVMLNNDNRIAEIAQMDEGSQKTLVVPLVKTNRGLIEDIHYANEARTNL